MGIEAQTIQNISHIHPLTLNEFDQGACLVCLEEDSVAYYDCLPCGFKLCIDCAKKPLVINGEEAHEHPLSILPKASLVFTCDACGEVKEAGAGLTFCVCILCCFTIHRSCISLPRVIYINRHDHLISHLYPIGAREGNCGVCSKKVDGKYAGYSCSVCSFVVHSKCATRDDVWDGEEIEDVPQEDLKEIIPFEVVGEGLIRHCSHGQHDHLKLILPVDDSYVRLKDKQCFACILQILSGPCYICSLDECDFILHERCANLLKKITHPASWSRLTLSFNVRKFYFENNNTCACCKRGGTGSAFTYAFRNNSEMFIICVRCASIKNGHVHASHPHSGLILQNNDSEDPLVCSICSEDRLITLKCIECESFVLCYRCATLPAVVNHKYDEHPVCLRYGENRNGIYWCEICETTLDPKSWFYTCDECGSTLHIDCVLGKDPSYRVGFTYFDLGKDIEVVQNNYVTRPYCQGWCSRSPSRCQGPVVFKSGDLFWCSSHCAFIYCKRYHDWW
ncbi:unnamed protein product [Eruca vesicaria subsp. sativa]|uniref:Phorbol-ester/DAG-type domain-containing protein n=1 Tax=Eruca vesicaria subsp. sativa TaxID=29727 RepID=A0ABC8J294_ERUVS|nr:unnamed protein product [Eruca vesicaria subsp. sativa]